MNNFTYENQGTNTYLVYKIEEDDILDTMSLGMITNNKIPGLAPSFFMQMDMSKYIKYNVSAKISVSQFFEGSVNQKRLIGVFSGIVDAMLSAEDYMIDVNSILMDLNHIFTDVSTCETNLICLPLLDTARQPVDLGTFFKNIMFSTRFDQTENCDYVAKIINYLNSTPVFSLVDFKEVLETIKGAKTDSPAQVPVREQPVVSSPVTPQPAHQNVQPPAPAQPAYVANPQPTVNVNQTVQPNVKPSIQPSNMPSNIAAVQAPQPDASEKQISMFYLLQHYNKENAAAYKAQKEAKKQNKTTDVKPQKEKPVKEKKSKKEKATPGFTIPGAPEPASSFAIPGVQGSNPGFAIPGQNPAPIPQPAVNQAANNQGNVQASGVAGQALSAQQVISQQTVVQTQINAQGQMNTQAYQPQMPQGHSMNFGETTLLSAGRPGETTVLSMATQVEIKPFLIRKKNNEKIMLNKPVFRIGKEKSYVDYFISDNTAISRSHANFISRDGEYFVVDTNSTNHTYVSGTMIQSNVEVKLTHGMKIRLANEDFEFWLY